MAVSGTLASMPLPDLLQWLGQARKTGTLTLEKDRTRKRILFREGRVVGCSADNTPHEMLGQFLLARGKITEEVLRRALDLQRGTGRLLGEVLVEMGVASFDEMTRLLRQKAEETIFSLFEWEDGSFAFRENEVPAEGLFPVSLRVEDVLLRGAQRYDEMRRVRAVFHDPDIVLRHTDTPPPPQILQNRMAWRIYMSVNGQRSVAEILLHAHGSEFVVTRFLFELFRSGLVEIAGHHAESHEAAAAAALTEPAQAAATGDDHGTPARSPAAAAAAREPDPASPAQELASARRLVEAGHFESALDILEAAQRSRPEDEAVRQLLAAAELGFVEKAYKHYVPPSRIPVLVRPPESLTGEKLSPQEFFLLSRMDGAWDVRSILQIAPIREVEALRALKRLRERGLIDLRDPESGASEGRVPAHKAGALS